MESDVFVYLIELPIKVRGVTTPNDDGTFTVYINSVLDIEEQRNALNHELVHIRRDHFYNGRPVGLNELEARSLILNIDFLQLTFHPDPGA